VIIAINLYTAYGVCSREFQYNTLLAQWKENLAEGEATAEVEPDIAVDVFNLQAETDEPEEPSDSYDELYTEAEFMDYFFVAMQCINIGLSGYGLYTTITGSYYWFTFGRNISVLGTAIYNVVMIFLDWRTFVYKRH
jgi:hypothetical protein